MSPAKSPPSQPPTCNEILLLPAGVQQPAAHGGGWGRVDELYVLVRAFKHLGRRSSSEQLARKVPCPWQPPALLCPITLICLISYWIRLMGFPYMSLPESTSFAETAFARITATRGGELSRGAQELEVWDAPTQPPHRRWFPSLNLTVLPTGTELPAELAVTHWPQKSRDLRCRMVTSSAAAAPSWWIRKGHPRTAQTYHCHSFRTSCPRPVLAQSPPSP